jgi:hypothetical protein
MHRTKCSKCLRLTTTWRTTTKPIACVDVHEVDAHAADDGLLAIERRRRATANRNPRLGASTLSPIRKPAAHRLGWKPSACWSIRTSSEDRPVVAAVEAAVETETRDTKGEAGADNVTGLTASGKNLFRLSCV